MPISSLFGFGALGEEFLAFADDLGALFVRQVVAELRKVIWPIRRELITYTTVALAFIIVMVAIVTSLDYGFTKLVFEVFG